MAKLAFTKLGLKPNNDVVNIYFNEQAIEVKQYLPTDKKLDIITNVLELSHDSNNFSNQKKTLLQCFLNFIDRYSNFIGYLDQRDIL